MNGGDGIMLRVDDYDRAFEWAFDNGCLKPAIDYDAAHSHYMESGLTPPGFVALRVHMDNGDCRRTTFEVIDDEV